MRVKLQPNQISARHYIDRLASSGHYHFTSRDAREALGVSPDATKLALNRLAKQDLIASPARGFYVIGRFSSSSICCLEFMAS